MANIKENEITRIFSIKELQGMIEAIKKDNPHYNKKILNQACGIFKIDNLCKIEHRHIGIQDYKRVNI